MTKESEKITHVNPAFALPLLPEFWQVKLSLSVGGVRSRKQHEEKVDRQPALNLDAKAILALDNARALPPGPGRVEAMKLAGILRVAADRIVGPKLPRRGRPPR